MKKTASFYMTLFICMISQIECADIPIKEQRLWEILYDGDWSQGRKMILSRQIEDTNDIFLNTFMFAYLSYRNGNNEGALEILKSLDHYIEDVFLNEGRGGSFDRFETYPPNYSGDAIERSMSSPISDSRMSSMISSYKLSSG